MDRYTLDLALLDFVPNIAFLIGAYYLVKLVLHEHSRSAGRLMMISTLFVFLGGLLKAIWKLLYTIGVADITLFAEQQFFMAAIGFSGMAISVILLARSTRAPASLPATSAMFMALWKIPFLAVMVIASLAAQGILAYIAFRRNLTLGGILFSLSVMCMLGMAGLASGEQTVARQWIAEIVNSFGQSTFALGAFLLYKQSLQLKPAQLQAN